VRATMEIGGPFAGPALRPPRAMSARTLALVLILPALAALALFFFYPIAIMAWRSVSDPSPAVYLKFFDSPVYLRALFGTIWMSAVVTGVCLLLAYPYAYAMYRASGAVAFLLSILVLLPFWSSLLVRTYAWTIILRDGGIINWTLIRLGLIEAPLTLMGNRFAVILGMSHVLLPFMVLPIYAAMLRFDATLAQAAASLGATRRAILARVFVPLTLPGILAGSLLVFVLSIGFYITPAILGGRTAFFSTLVVTQISRILDFGFGSALGMILLVVVLAVVGIGARFVPLTDLFGGSRR
jgi:putative spermidine/putrescine transport system permease protein